MFDSRMVLGPLRVEEWQKQSIDFDSLLSDPVLPTGSAKAECVMPCL